MTEHDEDSQGSGAESAQISGSPSPRREGCVHLVSWAGTSRHRVVVLGETPARYRVEYVEPAALPPRFRAQGQIQLVPKHAVTFDEEKVDG